MSKKNLYIFPRMKRLITYTLFLLAMAVSVSAQTTFYVSPKGKDTNQGTINSPLKNIQSAVNKAKAQAGNVEIVLKGGNYQLDKTIEISNGNWDALTILSANNEKVFVSGDKIVPLKSARKIKDKSILERLQPQVRDQVYVVDFKKMGISIENLHPTGFGRPNRTAWNELFVDDKPLTISCWPNDSMLLIGNVLVAGNKEDKKAGKLPVFQYKSDRPKNWKNASNVWIGGYFGYGYADDMVPVKEIDTENSTIYAGDFTTYQFLTGTDYRRWYALNLIEEIDMPGEYAIDHENGKFYFYTGNKFSKLRLSVLGQPLFVVENCKNVTLKNLTVENSRDMGVYIENAEKVLVDGCTFRNLGNVAVCMGMGTYSEKPNILKHSMEYGGEPKSRVIGDMMGKVYEDVTFNRRPGKNNGVKNCHIYNVGSGGISLGGGDRKTLTPSNNFVENCRIQRYNRIEKSYRPAVWMDGVGNRVSNCDISDAPSMAILFHGNNHVIEYCKITNVCTEVDDQGAIYYGRDPSEQGNIIRYNYFKELSPKHRVTATYHDDGACGAEVYGNIYFRAGSKPVLIGGGQDNHYYNNIFISSPIAIHLDNRLQNWGANMVQRNGIFETRLKAVNYTQPPYSTAYPKLVKYFDDNPAYPKRNRFERNLFYKIENVIHGKSQWGEFWNNWTTNDDPGFVDAENPLKGFKKDAPVFEKIKGFENIPFEKIGCTLP